MVEKVCIKVQCKDRFGVQSRKQNKVQCIWGYKASQLKMDARSSLLAWAWTKMYPTIGKSISIF